MCLQRGYILHILYNIHTVLYKYLYASQFFQCTCYQLNTIVYPSHRKRIAFEKCNVATCLVKFPPCQNLAKEDNFRIQGTHAQMGYRRYWSFFHNKKTTFAWPSHDLCSMSYPSKISKEERGDNTITPTNTLHPLPMLV
jgi:hypothetical protein